MLRSMFKQPKAPKPQKMPEQVATPTVDEAANRAEDDVRMRRRKGRSAYMLSKSSQGSGQGGGQSNFARLATKVLTGS